MFSLHYVIRRLVRQPLVAASIMLGIVLAVALGVAVPLATNALAVRGLRASIDVLPPPTEHIQLVRQAQPFDPAVQQHIRQQLGNLLVGDYTMSYLALRKAHREQPLMDRNVRLRTQAGLADHIVVTGNVPQPNAQLKRPPCGPATPSRAPLEALVSAEQLKVSGLTIGDYLCIDGQFPIVLTGSFLPKNSADPYWFGDLRPVIGESPAQPSVAELIVVLMLNDDDFNTVAGSADNPSVTHVYRGLVQTGAITIESVNAVARRLTTLRTELAATQPAPMLMQTALVDAIATFATRFQLLQSVLLALMLLLVSLAMIYVVLVGTLATQQQLNELTVLRSRGASGRQLLLLHIGQALVLAVPGALLGWGLGALAVLLLGRTAQFQRLGGGAGVTWRWTTATWLLPATILLVALFALVWAARQAFGRSPVTLRYAWARPPRRARWRGVQLDGLLLLLAVWGVWQLQHSGGTLITTPDGGVQFNLLALATPALVLLVGALLLLRLFPLVVRGLGGLLSRRRGLAPALSAWQLARNPVLYGRLVLLLTLTVGLGIYSQVATSTIARLQLRHAVQQVGADVRVPLASNDDPAAILSRLPAAAATSVSRIDAELLRQQGVSETQQGTVALLGVDGPALSKVLALSGSDDTAWLAVLRQLGAVMPPLGLPLPPGTTALQLDLQGDIRGVTVYAKFAGANSERVVSVGRPGATWQQLEAPVPSDLQPPVALQAFLVAPGTQGPSTGGQQLVFDQLVARIGTTHVSLPDFERPNDWEAIGSSIGAVQVNTVPGMTAGRSATALMLDPLPVGQWAALRFRIPATLPVYLAQVPSAVSGTAGQPLLLRVDLQRISAVVQQELGRFPGVEDDQTVVIADRGQLDALLRYGRPTTGGPGQFQAGVATGVRPTELRVALLPGVEMPPMAQAITKASALLAQAADPLSNGVRVILLLGFGCALILSLSGFLTFSTLTIQARQIDWTVLSALGVSRLQLLMMIAGEQGIVLGGSVVAGLLAGLLLAWTTQAFLPVAVGNVENTPVGLAWQGVLLMGVGLVLALVAALVLVIIQVQRRGITRALRLGEG